MPEIVEVKEPFGTIYVDPPWAYQNWTEAKNGAASSHYDGMTWEEIARIPVGEWSAKDAMLFLWATWPKLPEAMAILQVWGFNYVTAFPWVKVTPSAGVIRTGIGFWTQSASELVIIARKGKPKRKVGGKPVVGLLCGSEFQFYCAREEHSKKPEEISAWIERTTQGPYLELFGTKPRANWSVWGLATGYRLSPDGVERVPVPERIFGEHGRE